MIAVVDQTARAELQPGECLAGRYRILGVLGAGGMATVYKANDLRLKRDVAIKVVLPELRRNWKTLQRFMREAQAMATIDSPWVVPVYDVGQDGERYFMVMKLLDAPALCDLLDRGALPEARALSIVAGVVEGLRDLHNRGIVHRDVKPSNIVVRQDDRPILLDFGIVLEVGEPSLTLEGMLVGTPHYMAPEQIFAPTGVDGRADLYAVGVLFFEVLTGRLPYQGKTPQALMQSHLTRETPDPKALAPHLSPATTAIVQQALMKDPDLRYQSADEMLLALRDAMQSTAAVPPSLTADLPVEPTDRFALALVGAAMFALALLIFVTPLIEKKPKTTFAEVKAVPLPTGSVSMALAPPKPKLIVEEPTIVEGTAPRSSPPPARPAPRKEPEKGIYLAAVPAVEPEVKQAQAMLRGGDLRGAIRQLAATIQKNPKSPAPYPTLGDAYALTGNKIAAIAAYRRYLALSPHGEGAKRVETALARLGGR